MCLEISAASDFCLASNFTLRFRKVLACDSLVISLIFLHLYFVEDAKKETEKVQRRVEIAEQDRDEAIRKAEQVRISAEEKLEHEKSSKENALEKEREARIELQTALDTEKVWWKVLAPKKYPVSGLPTQ